MPLRGMRVYGGEVDVISLADDCAECRRAGRPARFDTDIHPTHRCPSCREKAAAQMTRGDRIVAWIITVIVIGFYGLLAWRFWSVWSKK